MTHLTTTLRHEADAAKQAKDYRRAAALLAILADMSEPYGTDKQTSPTWRETRACMLKA